MLFHKAETFAEAKEKLLIGYKVVSELVDGVTVPPLPDGLKHYTFLTSLLINHGLELREWLAENGCVCRCAEPVPHGGSSDAETGFDEIKDR
jgi:hypothetical protein